MPESFLKNTLQELIERWSKANFQYELIAVAEKDIKLSLYSTHDLYTPQRSLGPTLLKNKSKASLTPHPGPWK